MPDIIPLKAHKHRSPSDLLRRCKDEQCWRMTSNAIGLCRWCLTKREAAAACRAAAATTEGKPC